MRHELLDLPQPNWFHHGPQILDLLEQHQPIVCVELGSNRGCSAIAVARLLRTWGGTLSCVDCWKRDATLTPSEVGVETFIANVAAAGVADSIRIVHATTLEAARQWRDEIDYLYVDADHSYAGCTRDLELWWPFVKVGGLVAGDDYDDPYGIPQQGVTRAWDEFEQRHGQAFERTHTPGLVHASRLIWGIKR